MPPREVWASEGKPEMEPPALPRYLESGRCRLRVFDLDSQVFRAERVATEPVAIDRAALSSWHSVISPPGEEPLLVRHEPHPFGAEKLRVVGEREEDQRRLQG